MFAAIGVQANLLEAAGVHRVTDQQAREKYVVDANAYQDFSGIVFPYFDPTGTTRRTARIRRDNPEIEGGKAKGRYHSPYGDKRHLYFPPSAAHLFGDVTVPVVFVEAEKSVLALTALSQRTNHPLLAIGTGGCWGWRGKIGKLPLPHGGSTDEKGPLPDLDLMSFGERDVVICFDSNTATNDRVAQAQLALADELHGRGANVRIAVLPGEGGVNGPDDFICKYEDKHLLDVLDGAQPSSKVSEALARRAIASVEKEPDDFELIDAAYRSIARVERTNAWQILSSKLRKVLGVPPQTVNEAIKRERTALKAVRAAAHRSVRLAYLRQLHILPSEIIANLESFFEDYAYLPASVPLLLALWAVNTWCFDLFDTTPYLMLRSATPQCGKTTVLQLLQQVVCNPERTSSLTPAATYRLVELEKPTLLVDESEGLNEREAGPLRAVFNASYKRGSDVVRCSGEDYSEVSKFHLFCPVAFAQIGSFSGALLDRCIVIDMEMKPPSMPMESVREQVLREKVAPWREQLEAYAVQNADALTSLCNRQPAAGYWAGLGNREAELFTPLLLHARLAGAEVEDRAIDMALNLSRKKKARVEHQPEFEKIRELLEVLPEMPQEVSPGELVPMLKRKATWSAELELKAHGGAATSIGRFLQNFSANPRRDRNRGSVYQKAILQDKLRAALPSSDEAASTDGATQS